MADQFTGAVVSGLVETVIGKLGSEVIGKFSQIYGVKSQFPKLKNTLDAIEAVLQDAEEKQYKDKSIKWWLENLKDVVYDIDDLLDWISTVYLENKVNGKNPWRRFNDIFLRYSWAKQLEDICSQLDAIQEVESRFNLRGYQSTIPVDNSAEQRETSSHILESDVFGREQDKDLIVSRLVSNSIHEKEKFFVFPVIGMGGIGKSTLAKLVFNDPRVKLLQNFNWRLWAYVSENFVLSSVIGDIIQSATGENCSNLNLQALQSRLHEILAGQTFFLVLDDVWVEDLAQWEKLMELLVVGSRSAILVTTREERVASITGTIEPYWLKGLSHDHCWSIFVKCAFKRGEEGAYPLLVKIGKSIIEKCKGVPLAVKTLGCSLRNERDLVIWEKIEGSELWKIDQGPNGILPALKLSFDHTPSHLRSCFAYCAIFGKGYPLHRNDLINVWMAQGLLQEHDGDKCFDELLSRSFFQFPGYAVIEKYVLEAAGVFKWHTDWVNLAQSFKNNMIGNVDTIRKHFTNYRGKLPFVEMHDLMQDLAAYVNGEEIARVSSCTCKISAKARHLVWDKEDLSEKEFPKVLMKASKARTSAFLHRMGSLRKSFLESLLLNLKCLRVLMLCESEFEELPDLIGDLKHLRYLDVSLNLKLKVLPNAICKLVNLQVLDFGHCYELEKLPKDMHRLVSIRTLIVTSKATCLSKKGFWCWSSLRVLKIIKCPNLTSLPEGMGSLKSLRVFGVERCSSLASLPDDMNQLTSLEELSIGHCQQLDLAQWDGLNGLQNLKYLRLYGIPNLIDFPDGLGSIAQSLQLLRIGDCEVLKSLPERLELCTSLLKLQVYGCGKLSKLPVGVQALKDLQELTIAGCSDLTKRCEMDIGDDWHLISHIPYIHIDHQVIQNKALSTQE